MSINSVRISKCESDWKLGECDFNKITQPIASHLTTPQPKVESGEKNGQLIDETNFI